MRISSNYDDIGYRKFCELKDTNTIEVYLDGVLIEHCMTADEEQGFIFAYKLKNGRPYAEGLSAATYTAHGKVSISLRPMQELV